VDKCEASVGNTFCPHSSGLSPLGVGVCSRSLPLATRRVPHRVGVIRGVVVLAPRSRLALAGQRREALTARYQRGSGSGLRRARLLRSRSRHLLSCRAHFRRSTRCLVRRGFRFRLVRRVRRLCILGRRHLRQPPPTRARTRTTRPHRRERERERERSEKARESERERESKVRQTTRSWKRISQETRYAQPVSGS
jgi:hypothetical protein